MKKSRLGSALSAIAIGGMTFAGPYGTIKEARAQALPTPLAFVSNVDMKCYAVGANAPSLNMAVALQHLNPVLAGLPTQTVMVQNLQQVCVPVMKNGVVPPSGVLPFVQFLDLACYRIAAPIGPNVPLSLKHLNPVLQQLGAPVENVVLQGAATAAQQLCVPVAKNGMIPPPAVQQLIRYVDLRCYALDPQPPLNFVLNLAHLNPVLQQMGLPQETVQVTTPRQLCVPVRKNNQAIPPETLNIVRWLDLKKYDVIAPPLASPIPLTLTQLNPLFANVPPAAVQLIAAQQLGLPVAKNNVIPPG